MRSARKYGVRLVIPLTDNYNYYHGGKHDFVRWSGVGPDDNVSKACVLPAAADPELAAQCPFYSSPAAIGLFKRYVLELLSLKDPDTGVALKDDPTVLAWETGNELVGCPANWTANISTFIRVELGARQLVMDGRDVVRMGPDPELARHRSVDLVTDHYYPIKPTLLAPHAATAAAAGKVFTVGEYDWAAKPKDLDAFLDQIVSMPDVAGDLYWSLFPHADAYGFVKHGDGFSLHYPGDTPEMMIAVATIRRHAFAMRGLVEPPTPTVVTVPPVLQYARRGCVVWRGATLAGNYTVEKSADDGATWHLVIEASGATEVADTVMVPGKGFRDPGWESPAPEQTLYRVRPYSLAGVPGPYSNQVTGERGGTTALCFAPPPPTPPGPPGPGPSAPPSTDCSWVASRDYNPGPAGCSTGPCRVVHVATKEACCGACRAARNCLAGVFQPPLSKCFLKPEGSTAVTRPGDNITACIPL